MSDFANAGTSIKTWKEKKIKDFAEKLAKVENKIEEMRFVIKESTGSSMTYAGILSDFEHSVIVRFTTTCYLHSNEIFKDGDNITIVNEIKSKNRLIQEIGEDIDAAVINIKTDFRPTVSGEQPQGVVAELLVEFEL